MDSNCYKCGALVQDGTAFCPACGAPQIRVSVPEPAPADTPSFIPGTPGEMQPPAVPVVLAPMVPQTPAGIDWKAARAGILVAGLLMGVVAMFPLGFLLIIPGGALAVSRYQRKRGSYVSPGDGAKIGSAAGLLGYIVFSVLAGIMFIVNPASIREPIHLAIQRAQTQNPDPNMQQIYQSFSTPQGMALLLTIIMIIFFVAFLVFSSAGGAISAAISRRGSHR